MNTYISTLIQLLEFNRNMTLKLLEEIAQLKDPASALSYQPGAQRAHIGWQIMHIAITEELFATERLRRTPSNLTEWFPQFQKGSIADNNIPTVKEIKNVLAQTRSNVIEAISEITEDQLELIPDGLTERGWTNRTALQILSWHEAHHQGQAHFLLNSWKADQ
ncbi:MAG: DinB family protein [Gimesia sp.]